MPDYSWGEESTLDDYPDYEDKLGEATRVINAALDEYESLAIELNGDPTSTLLLYLVSELSHNVSEQVSSFYVNNSPTDEITEEYVRKWAAEFEVPLTVITPSVIQHTDSRIGDIVETDELPTKLQTSLKEELKYGGGQFELNKRGYVGGYLLDTHPVNEYIESDGIEALIVGDQWGDQLSNSNKTFFDKNEIDQSDRHFDYVRPLLPFTEYSVWRYTWTKVVPDVVNEWDPSISTPEDKDDIPDGVSISDIPVHPRYYNFKKDAGKEVSDKENTSEAAWLDFLDRGESDELSDEELETYVTNAKALLSKAKRNDDLGLLFTGGKDSVILLHLWRDMFADHPPLLIVDTHNQFQSVYDFRDELKQKWDLTYDIRSNEDFLENVIWNDDDEREFAWDGFKTQECCQRLKVDVIADFINSDYNNLISGRRSEDVNGEIDAITDRSEPLPHRRFHPLHDWPREAIEGYIRENDLPLPSVYDEGYVHTDCVDCTLSGSEGDDWVDVGSDKRESLNKLRELGYF